jgi:alcohol dehydrogenase, propanol-preferring
MGYRVIGIDISPDALLEAKAQGAEHVFSPIKDKDYVATIKQLTTKGCKAAINFTNSTAAYATAPDVLRTNGLLLVVGIPQQPLTFKAIDLSMCKFRVKGANNGTTPTLKKCIEFSHKYGIKPHVEVYSLDQFEEMVDVMKQGRQRGRLGVVFD